MYLNNGCNHIKKEYMFASILGSMVLGHFSYFFFILLGMVLSDIFQLVRPDEKFTTCQDGFKYIYKDLGIIVR